MRRSHVRAVSSIGQFFTKVPTISVKDTLILYAHYAKEGLHDALRWKPAVEAIESSKIIQTNLTKSLLMQVVVLVSALILEPWVLWMHDDPEDNWEIDLVIHLIWLFPASLVASSFTYLYSGQCIINPVHSGSGSKINSSSTSSNFFSNVRSTRFTLAWAVERSYFAFAALNWFLVSYVLDQIWFIGPLLSIIYMSVVNAYYCFEPQWIIQGWSFYERVDYLEKRWPYFLGFGLPSTLVSFWWSDPTVRLALYSILFPFFVLTASNAIPQPSDTSVVTAPKTSFLPDTRSSYVHTEGREFEDLSVKRASDKVPKSLPVFLLAKYSYELANTYLAPGGHKKSASNLPPSRSMGYPSQQPPYTNIVKQPVDNITATTSMQSSRYPNEGLNLGSAMYMNDQASHEALTSHAFGPPRSTPQMGVNANIVAGGSATGMMESTAHAMSTSSLSSQAPPPPPPATFANTASATSSLGAASQMNGFASPPRKPKASPPRVSISPQTDATKAVGVSSISMRPMKNRAGSGLAHTNENLLHRPLHTARHDTTGQDAAGSGLTARRRRAL